MLLLFKEEVVLDQLNESCSTIFPGQIIHFDFMSPLAISFKCKAVLKILSFLFVLSFLNS